MAQNLAINTSAGDIAISLPNGTAGQVMAMNSATPPQPVWSSSAASASASTTLPLADGVAAVGTGITWARADHVHPQEAAAEITIGSSVIVGGTTTRVLYDAAGIVGELAVTGSGSAVLSTSPALVTPTLGVATATKLTFGTTTNGILGGAGASTGRAALGATAGNGIELYLDTTHTSGDTRGIYANLTFSGASGGGEALRAYGIVNNVTAAVGDTVNGAHISLDFVGANAKISGAGNALRATFGISDANSTAVGGTCSTIQVDTWFDNAITVPPNFAFLRFTNTGTKVAANLMSLPAPINGAGKLFCAHTTDAMTHSIRVVDAAGTAYYLMATTTTTNRATS